MCASASADSNWRTRSFNRLTSLNSPGFSTLTTFFNTSSLPYCRTHRDTVSLPLIPYASDASYGLPYRPSANSDTTCRLNASLYRITFSDTNSPSFGVNLYQDATAFSVSRFPSPLPRVGGGLRHSITPSLRHSATGLGGWVAPGKPGHLNSVKPLR